MKGKLPVLLIGCIDKMVRWRGEELLAQVADLLLFTPPQKVVCFGGICCPAVPRGMYVLVWYATCFGSYMLCLSSDGCLVRNPLFGP